MLKTREGHKSQKKLTANKLRTMFSRTKAKIANKSLFNRVNLSVFAVIFAGIGGFLIINSFAVTPAGKANLWVDLNGGSCSHNTTTGGGDYVDAQACSSMQAAVAAATAGDTIRMKAGTYGAQTITTNMTSPGVTIIAEDGTAIGSFSPQGNYVEYQNFTAGNMDLENVNTQHVTLRNVNVANGGHVTLDGPDYFSWIGGTLGSYVIDHGDWPGRVMIQGIPDTSSNILLDGLTVKPVTRTAAAVSNGDHTEIIRFNQGVNGATLRNMTFESGSNINSAVIFVGGAGAATNETNLTFENNFFGQNSDAQPLIDSNGQGAACTTWLIDYNTNASSNNLFPGGSTNCTSQANITLRGNLGKLNGANSCGNAVYDNNVWSNSAGCGGGDLANQSISFTGDGFHLPAGSPAINNGSSICPATDHDGGVRTSPCDAGAHEYGSVPAGGNDTTPPDTTITSVPIGSTTSTSASFTFTSTESPSTFQCQIDGGAFSACSSPQAYTGLAVGAHSFAVRATDSSNNTDQSPDTENWTISSAGDTTAPITTISSQPPSSTTSTSASFSFSANETATFQCKLDTGNYVSCSSPQAYTVAVGAHTFTVKATDTAGNAESTGDSYSWTVTAPPVDTPPVVSLSAPANNFVINSTTANPVAVTATATDNNSVSNVVFKWTKGATTTTIGTDTTGDVNNLYSVNWSTTSLADGTYTLTATATDSASQTTTSTSRTVTVDKTAPVTTISSTPSSPTNNTSASFAVASNETGSTFECRIDAGAFSACSTPNAYTGLLSGNHTFNVRAIDAVGNVDATPASYSWTIDLTGPTTQITSTNPSGTSGNTTTQATTASFTFASSETLSTFQCQLDSAAYAACNSGTMSYSALSVGSHTFRVKATDQAGNVDPNTPPSFTWTVASPSDTTFPTVAITVPATNGATVSNTTSISASATDPGSPSTGIAGVQFKLNGNDLGSEITSPTTGSIYTYSWNTGGVTNGSYSLTAVTHDGAGHFTTSAAVTLTVNNTVVTPPDTTPPSVPTNLSATPTGTGIVALAWGPSTDSGTGASGVAGYKVYRSTTTGSTAPASNTYTVVVTTTSGSGALTATDSGLSTNTTYYYKVSAIDNASTPNESAKSTAASVTTNDIAPTVTITANPTTINSGETTKLSWSYAHATVCTAAGDWSGTKGNNVTNFVTPALTKSSTFTLSCSGSGGSTNASAQVTVNGSTTPPPDPTPYAVVHKPGDVNGDNVINIYDLSLLARHWNQAYEDADFKDDGIVNIYDLSILANNWGK